MTTTPVDLAALLARRERMLQELQAGLDAHERRFLLSLVTGRPEWSLLGIAHAEHLPGIRWKLHNLAQLERNHPRKFAEQADALAQRLGSTKSAGSPPQYSRVAKFALLQHVHEGVQNPGV